MERVPTNSGQDGDDGGDGDWGTGGGAGSAPHYTDLINAKVRYAGHGGDGGFGAGGGAGASNATYREQGNWGYDPDKVEYIQCPPGHGGSAGPNGTNGTDGETGPDDSEGRGDAGYGGAGAGLGGAIFVRNGSSSRPGQSGYLCVD